MNRIPVLNDEQRAAYGAPTTEVETQTVEVHEKHIVVTVKTPGKAARTKTVKRTKK